MTAVNKEAVVKDIKEYFSDQHHLLRQLKLGEIQRVTFLVYYNARIGKLWEEKTTSASIFEMADKAVTNYDLLPDFPSQFEGMSLAQAYYKTELILELVEGFAQTLEQARKPEEPIKGDCYEG